MCLHGEQLCSKLVVHFQLYNFYCDHLKPDFFPNTTTPIKTSKGF